MGGDTGEGKQKGDLATQDVTVGAVALKIKSQCKVSSS